MFLASRRNLLFTRLFATWVGVDLSNALVENNTFWLTQGTILNLKNEKQFLNTIMVEVGDVYAPFRLEA